MDKTLEYLKESWNTILICESLAPGSEQIVSDLNNLPTEDEFNGVGIAEASPVGDAEVTDIDPMTIANSKTDNPNIAQGIERNRKNPGKAWRADQRKINPDTGRKFLPAERPQRMIHNSPLLRVLTSEGTEIDGDELKKLITVRPKNLIGQNSKLAISGAASNEVFYDLTLPAYQGLFYNEQAQKFQVVKTCPSAGACKAYCYATSGGYVQYEGSWLLSTRTVNFLMNDYEGFKAQLLSELQVAQSTMKKKGKKLVLRWHDSGDFYSETYLMLAFDVARQTPNTRHYAYTKQVAMVQKHAADKPDNFLFNFSKGGTQDNAVNFNTQKHSKVVPYVLFKDLHIIKKQPLSRKVATEIKKRVIYHYNLDAETVITYKELIKLPVNTKKNKYNVIVRPGDGDDAASRSDVLGTYLLIH